MSLLSSSNKNKTKEDNSLIVLRNEILMSELLVKDIIVPQMEEAISRYTSTHSPPYDADIVLNEIYPIIQHELPSIFFRTPRAFLKPRNKNYIVKKFNPVSGKKEDFIVDSQKSARTQEPILNYSIERMRYKDEMRKALLDALLFKFGVLWHGYKGDFGMTEEQSIIIENEEVFVKRISPDRFIFDPKVTISNINDAEWIGRSFDVPLRDIIEDDRLNVDDNIKGKDGFGHILNKDNPFINKQGVDNINVFNKRRTLLDHTEKDFRKHAQFITVHEILKRPTKKEKRDGKRGEILLLTDAQVDPLRRNAWPYKTQSWPAKILMFNDVPEQFYGMSDIEVWGMIADHKNLIINMQLRNAESNSKVIIGYDKGAVDEEERLQIQNGEQNIIGFDGDPRGKLTVASPGGSASSELYLIDQRIQANLDEKSGITDLKKGFLRSGEESATSVRIRNAGASARPAYRQDIMSDFLKSSFKFINDLNQQFMPIKEAVRITGSLDIEWSDNPTKEEIQADVDVEIDVVSMLPESPEKEIQELQTVLALLSEAVNNPNILTKLQQEGKTFNISPIVEQLLMRLKIRDPEVFRNVRPEESLGFASVAELRVAEENVKAAVAGQEIPSPPAEGQQHNTRLGVYTAQLQIQQLQGQVNEALVLLTQLQQQVAEQETKQKAPRQNTPLKSPKVRGI